MSRVAYVDGQYLPHRFAAVHVEDRGYQFADGVYEVLAVVRRNRVHDGIVYLQITRGVAPRDHAFPKAARPVLTVTSRSRRSADPRVAAAGVAVITLPDLRWRCCDIKSVALLPNVLGKQQAREAGAYEAWLVDDEGHVTEGTSTNAWIVTADGF